MPPLIPRNFCNGQANPKVKAPCSYVTLILLVGLLWQPLASADTHQSKTPSVTSNKAQCALAATISKVQSLKIPYAHGVAHAKVQGNAASPQAILFIHGTPGSAEAFARYLSDAQLNSVYLNVSIDRPGWGLSTQLSGAIGEFAVIADAALAVMQQFSDKQWIIVGHSLGASMAPTVMLAAAKDGIQVTHLVLLAGSLEPELGEPRWFNRLASTWLARPFLSKNLNHSNREVMQLKSELVKQESQLKQLLHEQHRSDSGLENTAVVLIQGLRDSLVSPKNLTYARKTLRQWFRHVELVGIADAGHFLPWRQYDLVKHHLLNLNSDNSCE